MSTNNEQQLENLVHDWQLKSDSLYQRKSKYKTLSQINVNPLYTPTDLADSIAWNDNGFPGEYPFTRGIHPNGYRSRLWTMRMFAGYGLPEETNERFKFLLNNGQTGLSVAFDMPTLYGYDTDDQRASGEFGKCGVAVSSLSDMETLFEGIELDKITTSMTINSPAAIIWAMYIALAETRGIPIAKLGGTLQNDILKEYIAQNEYIFPPEPSMRLVTDTIEFATKHMPLWNPISVSGYHIREAGANAVQELAFTLADGFEYIQHCIDRGLDIDSFAPRFSHFFNVHNNLFEEGAKCRAARRIWAKELKNTYGALNERSQWLRFHAQTSGVALTAQQPENNVIRVTIQALAAVLGGCQSLHTNAKDEALALPSADAALQALRTQQIIASESGITDTVDPLGGSYYLESLTDQIESEVYQYFTQIDSLGGVIPALKQGFFQQEIAESAFLYQTEEDKKEQILIGVNQYQSEEPVNIPILRVDTAGEAQQITNLNHVRSTRDNTLVQSKLNELRNNAKCSYNLMPSLIEASKAYATLGEMMGVLREVFGEYQPSWNF